MRYPLNLFVGLVLTLPSFLSAQETESEEAYVSFIEGSWEEARALAGEQNKYIMVDAFTEWCGWCKVQDKNTFHHPKVAEFMDRHFVSVKIDFEKGVGIDLAMKYRVRAYPTLLFFTPKGKLAGRIVGYDKDIDKFITQVDAMRQEENHPPQIGDPNVLDPGFPDFYLTAFGKNGEKKRPSPETVAAWLDGQEDLYSEVVWNVMSMMSLTEAYQQKFLENYQTYLEKFGEKESQGVLNNIINNHFYAAVRAQEEEKLEEALSLLREYAPNPDQEVSMQVAYYQNVQDWDKLVAVVDKMTEEKGYEFTGMLNSAAWNMYLKCENQDLLAQAANWMKQVVAQEPTYAYLDTYAALLFKTGRYNEALNWANRAISVGKAGEENVEGTEELLEKIEAAMQENR